jgi:hypothetical protein
MQKYQDNMKVLFDHKAKNRDFLPDDLVLKWDSRREDSAKHGKFNHIWYKPFKFSTFEGKNSFMLENLDGKNLSAPVNRHYLKHYMQ